MNKQFPWIKAPEPGLKHLELFIMLCKVVLTFEFVDEILKCDRSNRGGEWSFKKCRSRKILAHFHRSRSLIFSAVVYVSESRFFD